MIVSRTSAALQKTNQDQILTPPGEDGVTQFTEGVVFKSDSASCCFL